MSWTCSTAWRSIGCSAYHSKWLSVGRKKIWSIVANQSFVMLKIYLRKRCSSLSLKIFFKEESSFLFFILFPRFSHSKLLTFLGLNANVNNDMTWCRKFECAVVIMRHTFCESFCILHLNPIREVHKN